MIMYKICIIVGLALLVPVYGDHPLPSDRDLIESYSDERSIVSRNEEQVYRLPETVIPLEYDIYLDLYFAEREDRPFTYDGRVDITIQAIEENVRQIVLHANVDRITAVTVAKEGLPHPLDNNEPLALEPEYHFLKVNLAQNLELGENYTLSVEYSSTMNEGPMKRGIWRGWYVDDNNVERIYATTHFQPYNARQAFPCWDEPLFKAVFKLHISRPRTYSGTFSNTGVDSIYLEENNRVRDNFLPTPRMSSYLLTFLVSETFQVIAEDTTYDPPIRIIGRSNTDGLANFALDLATKLTDYFDEYFGIPYASLHPNLYNDHISSPDWASAGTENWGMVSYRELYMIIDSEQTLMSVEHYAVTLISHELAHKWFGNLITCFWWSNTWINEGYASYFGYIGSYAVAPKYAHHEHFNNRYLQGSLSYDSSAGSDPMNHDVNTPAQVTAHFGTVSYSKGAAFIRMTVNLITPETFQKSCTYFLMDNAYQPTDQFDLLDAFVKAINEDNSLAMYNNFNFTEYYRIWVNEPGYPILTVDINHSSGEMAISQERFFLSSTATATGQIYPIPITYSTKSAPRFNELRPQFMMDSERMVITKTGEEEWVIFNNLQHGHYRVTYDTRTWNLIADALLSEPENIHHLNRAQVVDDVFALMRSNRMTYAFGFHILRFLRNELNYHVWDPAITGYTWLRNRLRHMPEKQAEFDAFILSYLENAIEHYSFGSINSETPTDVMARQDIMHFACTLGHARCVQESRHRFVEFRNDPGTKVHVGIRRNVFMVGVREGGEEDFNFMLNLARNTNYANDLLEMLRALASTKDLILLNRYLELTLTNLVRSHDKANSFSYGLLGNKENAYNILQFVKNNIDRIRVAYVEDSPARPVHTCLSNLASYLDEAGLDEYEEWLRSTQTSSLQYSTAISAINSARTNIVWGTANADTILGAARDGATKVVTSLVMLLVMASVAVAM